MARISVEEAGGRNVVAFLDMLAFSEGTSISRFTKDDGYDVIVEGIEGSPKVFSDYGDHPNIRVKVNSKGLYSTAAGRYQQLYRYWPHYRAQLGLGNFSPVNQDRLAIQLIKEQKALSDIKAGRIEDAIYKCNNIWASLTGSKYGQRTHSLSTLLKVYQDKGGKL